MTDKEILNYVKREKEKILEAWNKKTDGEERHYCMGYWNALNRVTRYIEGLEE
jgi:hypothetical protein